MEYISNYKDIPLIAVQYITNDYYWYQYGNLIVVLDIRTQYINATQMCKLISRINGTNDIIAWLQRQIQLLAELSQYVMRPVESLVKYQAGMPDVINGLYVHPIIVPYIIAWASHVEKSDDIIPR